MSTYHYVDGETFLLNIADEWCANVGRKVEWVGRDSLFGRWPFMPSAPPTLVRHDLVGAAPVGGPPLVVTPPFPSMLVYGNDGGAGIRPPLTGGRSYVAAVERWDSESRAALALSYDRPDIAEELSRSRSRVPDERWDVSISVFLERDGGAWVDRRWYVSLDDLGRPIGRQQHNGWGGWDDSELVSLDDLDDPRIRYPILVVQGVMHALALMNCKNVTVEPDPVALPPRPVRRRRDRDGLPTLEFKTLKVAPSATSHRTAPGSDTSSIPMHVCRGHFKTYAPDRPLFGKLVGTYWWQDHARGSSDVGTVDKDYELAP